MIQVVPVASFGRTMSEPRRPTELRRPVGSPNVSIRPVVPRVGSRDRHSAGRRRPVHACQPTPRRIRSGRLSRLHHGPKSSAASARGLVALPVVTSSARAVARFRSRYTLRASPLRSLVADADASRRHATLSSPAVTSTTLSRRRRWSASWIAPRSLISTWFRRLNHHHVPHMLRTIRRSPR